MKHFLRSCTCAVLLTFSLSGCGELASALLSNPNLGSLLTGDTAKDPELTEAPTETSSSPPLTSSEQTSSPADSSFDPNRSYTSLIIDARGLAFEPAMVPTLLSESGEEIFPASIPVNIDFLHEKGIAVYTYSLADAQRNSRTGRQPLIIKAQATSGLGRVILRDIDAKQIKTANQKTHFLQEFQLIFLLDPSKE